jgi:NAD(P)-dependent dehydrogenase (short-subunit alcohol dehydrogenase family)
MEIKGKVAIVTGGASGLGRATVEALVKAGAKVSIFDVNDQLGEALAKELGTAVAYHRVNVTDENDVKSAIAKTVGAFGSISVCVNCAGVGGAAKTVSRGEPYPLEQFARIININLVGSFNVLRLAAVEMTKNAPEGEAGERGVIVNTASIAAWDGQMGQAAYAASKGGIVSLALPVARDLARDGIRINTIAPGVFETPMMQSLPEKVREGILMQIEYPKRFGLPTDYAKLVLHMIDNAYLNGECVRLDAASRLPPR